MRRLVGSFLVLLLLLGAAADRVSVVELILRLPSWVQAAVGWLTPPEEWLIEQQIHVLPLALAVALFFLLVVTPGDMRRWAGGRLHRDADVFWHNAGDARQREAAEEFHWGLERCYRRYAEASQIASDQAPLLRLIDGLRFPAEFARPLDTPNGGTPVPAWPTPEGSQLWAFASDLFEKMRRSPSDDYLGIDTAAFLRSLGRIARFWDACGRASDRGRNAARLRNELAAYAREIKIIALLERARLISFSWNTSERSGLFRLAMEV